METVRLYTDLATNYNSRFDGSSGQFLYETDRRIIRNLLSGVSVKNVVDVPVGTGRVLVYLRDLDLEILGVDMTEEMLAQARSDQLVEATMWQEDRLFPVSRRSEEAIPWLEMLAPGR